MKTSDKTFFLVPGFKTQITANEYGWLISYLEERNIRVIKTPVSWDHNVLSKNADNFVEFYNARKGTENYVLGFSYGAVIALLTANTIKPKKLFLCSLSPAFNEDLKVIDNFLLRYIGKKRYADLSSYSAKKLAKDLQVPSVVFYGEKEAHDYPKLKKRCEETALIAKNSKLVIVKDAPHKIDFPAYKEVIEKAIGDTYEDGLTVKHRNLK